MDSAFKVEEYSPVDGLLDTSRESKLRNLTIAKNLPLHKYVLRFLGMGCI